MNRFYSLERSRLELLQNGNHGTCRPIRVLTILRTATSSSEAKIVVVVFLNGWQVAREFVSWP